MDSVLILDDEPDIALAFSRVAETVGYKSSFTVNPADFLKRVVDECPSHILLDLQMPDMDGVEVLRHLAAMGCKAKIILISGFDPRVVTVAAKLGVEQGLTICEALSKPLPARELKAILTKYRSMFDCSPDALRTALQNQEFFLKLQPKLALRERVISGFEALLRWNHPQFGEILPNKFIPEFEKHNLFKLLSDYVVEHSCISVKKIDASGCVPIQTSVNISAGDLSDLELANRLKRICSSNFVDPRQITLEITETVAMADPVTAMDNLTRLRLAGFKLSLDDFGTGFSSLAFLRNMPFNEIKIDMLFVREALRSKSDQTIIKAINSLGKAFNMSVVAEGCEDAETLDLLEKLECDFAQGFHISRPLTVDDAIEFLHSHSN
ncbi:EAL domain-containing protein [Alteromonas sp. 345S023]|uniref:EAL domain-containing protein n=1 Tax=Alteromonas profundi TaxID=2696062 RepID=A0A7X5LME9_9ALTE|nr:EAL domain-containing response regulator [Alteromonas profundi]NDV92022.1 EAL domain-containing protein [Alteromonas profundi]